MRKAPGPVLRVDETRAWERGVAERMLPRGRRVFVSSPASSTSYRSPPRSSVGSPVAGGLKSASARDDAGVDPRAVVAAWG